MRISSHLNRGSCDFILYIAIATMVQLLTPPSLFLLSAFPSVCDSQKVPSAPEPALPSLPTSHTDAAHLEEEYVHRVYNSIASHFSSTRHSPWPRVCHFLSSLTPGSMLADVGCGNGKYLGVNPEVIAVSILSFYFCCYCWETSSNIFAIMVTSTGLWALGNNHRVLSQSLLLKGVFLFKSEPSARSEVLRTLHQVFMKSFAPFSLQP